MTDRNHIEKIARAWDEMEQSKRLEIASAGGCGHVFKRDWQRLTQQERDAITPFVEMVTFGIDSTQ